MQQNIRIISFPDDGQPWRLDWLGDVFYRRQYRYTQPFIRVALSRVLLDPSGAWSYPTRFQEPLKQFHASVPVGTLADLRVGTIWKDGLMLTDPDYTSECFPFTANRNTTTLLKAGVTNDEHVFMLPFDAHPYHKAHTHSYCLQVSLDEGSWLIIPVPELICFYFGSSSNFLGRLFQGPFRETSFWSRAEIDGKKVAKVELAKGIAGFSASDVARVAFDPTALHAAKLIANSLMARTGPEDKSYPKTVFPFMGKTRLKVKGVWLDGVSPRTFLAFRILECTHKFPFEELKYTMSKRHRTENAEAPICSRTGNEDVATSSRAKGKSERLTNAPP